MRRTLASVRERVLRRIGTRLPGTPVWDRDWDVLCVLDGCRLDTFRATIGDCDRLRSVAASSQPWIRATFRDPPVDLGRVAYVSGNPFSAQAATPAAFGHFHEMGVETVADIETVPPRRLADYAIRAWRERERLGIDQMVVHFMQPHVPFRSRPEWFEKWRGSEEWGAAAWKRLRTGRVDREAWFEAYRDNLRWVWGDGVERLRANCDAEIAVTADHGNAAGELGIYGHPAGAPVRAVRDVPWTMIDGEDTGYVTPAVTLQDGHEPRDVAASLRALGYQQGAGE